MRLALLLVLLASTAFAGEGRILAQRVSAAGALVGPPVTVYSDASGAQSRPRVAFFDDRWLVVWHEWNGSDLDVKGARLAMDGTVLDTTPLDLASGTRTQAMPDVAPDSTGWMTVWHAFPSTNVFPSLYARRVDYDGTLNSALQFGDGSTIGSAPRIAWDSSSSQFLVMFTTFYSASAVGHTLRWSRLSTTPTASLSSQVLYAANNGENVYSPAMMPGGSWTVLLNGHSENYWDRTNPGEAAVSIETSGTLNTSGYLGNGSDINGAWVSYHTEFLDDNSWPYGGSAAATDASYVIGVWTRYHVGGVNSRSLYDGDLYAARIDAYNPVEAVGGTAISTASGPSECNPSLAGDGAGSLLVVYDKDTSGSTTLESRILTVDGSGITPGTEVQIRSAATGKRRSQSAVAYGDDGGGTTGYLVVWTEGWWGVL